MKKTEKVFLFIVALVIVFASLAENYFIFLKEIGAAYSRKDFLVAASSSSFMIANINCVFWIFIMAIKFFFTFPAGNDEPNKGSQKLFFLGTTILSVVSGNFLFLGILDIFILGLTFTGIIYLILLGVLFFGAMKIYPSLELLKSRTFMLFLTGTAVFTGGVLFLVFELIQQYYY